MKIVSNDIETTGLSEHDCAIIEIGAVIDDLSLPDNQDRPTFHCYVLPEFGIYQGEPFALSMHPKIFRRIADREPGYSYLKCDEVAAAYRMFLLDNGMVDPIGMKKKATVTGKNYAGFDDRFLRRLTGWDGVPLHHRVLDPGSLYFDPQVDTVLPDTKECMKRAGISGEVAHTAVDDAMVVIRLVRRRLLRTVGLAA